MSNCRKSRRGRMMKAETNGALSLTLISPLRSNRPMVEWYEVGTEPDRWSIQAVSWDSPRPTGLVPNGSVRIRMYDKHGELITQLGSVGGGGFLTVTLPACITLKGRWPAAGCLEVEGCAMAALGDRKYAPAVRDMLEVFGDEGPTDS